MARRHHYEFAHRVLRMMFLQDSMRFLALLKGPRAQEFLLDVWTRVGAPIPADDRIEPEGLRGSHHELTSGLFSPAALIELPPATEIAEAHLVAAVLADGPRYFTLEKGVALPAMTPRTVLCEWRAEGQHVNYGDGPAAEAGAFLAAVEAKVNE